MHGAPGLREYETYTAFERSVIRAELERAIDQHNNPT